MTTILVTATIVAIIVCGASAIVAMRVSRELYELRDRLEQVDDLLAQHSSTILEHTKRIDYVDNYTKNMHRSTSQFKNEYDKFKKDVFSRMGGVNGNLSQVCDRMKKIEDAYEILRTKGQN